MNTEPEMQENMTHCWDVCDKTAIADDLQQKTEQADRSSFENGSLFFEKKGFFLKMGHFLKMGRFFENGCFLKMGRFF